MTESEWLSCTNATATTTTTASMRRSVKSMAAKVMACSPRGRPARSRPRRCRRGRWRSRSGSAAPRPRPHRAYPPGGRLQRSVPAAAGSGPARPAGRLPDLTHAPRSARRGVVVPGVAGLHPAADRSCWGAGGATDDRSGVVGSDRPGAGAEVPSGQLERSEVAPAGGASGTCSPGMTTEKRSPWPSGSRTGLPVRLTCGPPLVRG
jgi:hypothetical protein